MKIEHKSNPSGKYPLSNAQTRILFVEKLDNSVSAYNNMMDYRVTGNLNIEVLEKSLGILIKRHEALRTIFPNNHDSPVQEVLTEVAPALLVLHLEHEPREKQEEIITSHSLRNWQKKFDFGSGPLFSFELLVLGREEYVLMLNLHHLVSDAVSIRIFLDELVAIYTALVEGRSADLPELHVNYGDYTVWENQWLKSAECTKQLEYWKKELAGAPDMLQLPLDYPRTKIQSFNGDTYHFTIDKSLRDLLVALGKKQNTSHSIPLMAAFAILLSRYSLQDDLVLGVPVSTRNHEELESLVGVLINNLSIRFNFSEKATFSDVVKMARDKFFAAFENNEVPFDRLVEELKVKRNPSINPIFQVLFNFLNTFEREITFPGAKMRLLEGERKTARTDLTLFLYDYKDGLDCFFEYNTDILRRETLERMAGHFLTLLRAVCERPELPVLEIPLLTEAESRLMIRDWNKTTVDFPRELCVHHMVEAQTSRTPGSIAVVDDQRQMTYLELNETANKLAMHLVKQGVKEGTIVALFVERTVDMIVGLLAISKAGGTYLPLDPIYPKARLELILTDAKPVLVLTQTSLVEKLPETGAKFVLLDVKEKYIQEAADNLSFGDPLRPAYILYTSGSTGKPKGVQVCQRSLVNLINAFTRMMDVTSNDILLTVSTIAFDIAELEVYLPLFNGGKLVIASQETVMNMDLLMTKIEESGATLFQATPVTYKMLMLNGWKGKSDLRVVTGGDALSKDLARMMLARVKEVYNCYGPTETTIYSTGHRISEKDAEGEGIVSIGKPLDNNTLYILNPAKVPVPVGVPGELYIGGEGVSPGYLNLPGLTSEKFLSDPFSGNRNGMMYRSGDLVQYGSDQTLFFLNRIDSQVKIRGFRIELGEIETVLSQHRAIKENVVIVRTDAAGERMLVAYYVKKDQETVDYQELRQYLKERLPDYMVPAAFMGLDKFPLTANNKIDKKALPEVETTAGAVSKSYRGPVSLTEKKLVKIWESILKLDKIGIEDDFFEIGGHSMIAMTMIIKIEKEFGIRLPLASLFERSTVRTLAELIDRDSKETESQNQWRSLVSIRPGGSKKPLFLIHGLGLNILLYTTIISHLDPDQPVYGLQAKGLNGTDEPLSTIEEIATYYISEIMTVDPEGPYAMAGFSLGGKIAFEMGRQLTAMGKRVSFLGLIDSTADENFHHLPFLKRTVKQTDHIIRYTLWNIGSLFTLDPDSPSAVFKRKIKGLERKITGMDVRFKKEDYVSKGKADELPKYLRKVHKANRRANRNYVVKPYSGSVHLFKAKKQTFYIVEPVKYGWDKYASGGVFIYEIPGEHASIFAPPNDTYFAEVLQRHLNTTGV
jgi:amino acid adenylation domain-containing protein